MLEKILDKEHHSLLAVAVIGAVIGLGQLLMSPDQMRLRYAVGRSIVSSGIATSAFVLLAWIPDAPTPLLVGAACLLASLGTSGLTMLAQRLANARLTVSAPEQPSKETPNG